MHILSILIIVGLIGWVVSLGGFSGGAKMTPPVDNPDTPSSKEIIDITAPIDAARAVVNQVESRSSASINLSNQGLTKVPSYVFDRTDATILDVSHNALEGALQSQVQHLKNLRTLDLSHNKFTGVPAEVGQLTQLEVLDLSYNPITGLPNEIGNLKNLKTLDLRGTEYSTFDLEIIRKALPNTTRVLTE